MTMTLDEETGERLKSLAAENDCNPNDYLADLVKRTVARNGNASNGTQTSIS